MAGAAGGYGTAGTGGIDVSSYQTIKQSATASTDGVYAIDPDGAGGNAPFSAYCDMTRDGGGWTLVSKLNSANAHSVSEPRGFIGLELNGSGIGLRLVARGWRSPNTALALGVVRNPHAGDGHGGGF